MIEGSSTQSITCRIYCIFDSPFDFHPLSFELDHLVYLLIDLCDVNRRCPIPINFLCSLPPSTILCNMHYLCKIIASTITIKDAVALVSDFRQWISTEVFISSALYINPKISHPRYQERSLHRKAKVLCDTASARLSRVRA